MNAPIRGEISIHIVTVISSSLMGSLNFVYL